MYDLVVGNVPDDSFYYFQIARNIMHGEGATLDGETVTNGFHPLWLALITPFFALDDRELPVQFALSLGAVFGAVTVPLVFDTVRRLTGSRPASLLAAAFFALHPGIVAVNVNGLESSVAVMMIAIVTWLFVIAARTAEPRTLPTYAVLGVAGGLMMLARMDTVLVFGFVLTYLLLDDVRRRRAWRGPILAGLVASLWLAPWFIWGWVATGSPVQDSALAGGTVQRDAFNAGSGDAIGTKVDHGFHLLREAIGDDLPKNIMVPVNGEVWPFWVALAIDAVLVIVTPTRHRRSSLAALGLLAVPLGGLLSMLFYEAGIRWFWREWYLAPYALFIAYAVGIGARWLEGVALDFRDRLSATQGHPSIPDWFVTTGTFLILALAIGYIYGPQRKSSLVFGYPWQRDVYNTRLWVAENTTPDARFAAYNAGIPAYLWDRTVVNIDGVVNRDAYHALKTCTTRDYVRAKQIDYVADSAGQLFLTDCTLSTERDMTQIAKIGDVLPVYVFELKAPQ